MLIQVTKMDRDVKDEPRIMRKKVYNNMIEEDFIDDVVNSGVIHAVLKMDDVDEAAECLETYISPIYNKHAPFKNIQVKKNYAPFITTKTRLLIMEKKELMKQQKVRESKEEKKELRRIGKEIKKSLKTDEEEYWKERLGDKSDSKKMWSSVKDLLGERKNPSPTFNMKKTAQEILLL